MHTQEVQKSSFIEFQCLFLLFCKHQFSNWNYGCHSRHTFHHSNRKQESNHGPLQLKVSKRANQKFSFIFGFSKCKLCLPLKWHRPQQLQKRTKRTFAIFWRPWRCWHYISSKSECHSQPSWISPLTSVGWLLKHRHRCPRWVFETAIFAIWYCQGVRHWGQSMP